MADVSSSDFGEGSVWPEALQVDPSSPLGLRANSYGALADLASGGKNALMSALQGARDLVMTPGDVWAGKIPQDQMAEVARNYALNLSASGLALPVPPGALAMTRGFHGTPHTFEATTENPFGEFRDSAIGSGEGAQAYGYGHYVAGNPKVAEGYAKALSRDDPHIVEFNGQPVQQQNLPESQLPTDQAALRAVSIYGGVGEANLAYQKELSQAKTNLFKAEKGATLADRSLDQNYYRGRIADLDSKLTWLYENRSAITSRPPGNLLEVAIRPDEHELLDWDKPLSEQSPSVQKGLQNLPQSLKDRLEDHADSRGYNSPLDAPEDFTGEQFYKSASHYNVVDAPEELSQALHEAGVPGIKYLDAGSRGKGEGTRNYVIFHPSNLKITARNGERLEPVDHDPWSQE